MQSLRPVEFVFATAIKDSGRRHSHRHAKITSPQKANVMVLREQKVRIATKPMLDSKCFFNLTQQSGKCNSNICTIRVKEEAFVHALST